MGGRRWTEPEDAIIRDLTAVGTLHRKIAEVLGRTVNSVRDRAHTIGAQTPPELARLNSLAGNRAMHADPIRRRVKNAKITQKFTPERRKRQAEIARQVNAARDYANLSPETRRALGKGFKLRAARRMAWLPEERRVEYDRLVKRVGAGEAKRRILADMTPFERQMQAIRNGAGISTKPNLSKSYDYTLAGGSPL